MTVKEFLIEFGVLSGVLSPCAKAVKPSRMHGLLILHSNTWS